MKDKVIIELEDWVVNKNKDKVKKLIEEFHQIDSRYTLEEIITSIIYDTNLTDENKIKFIRIKLEMDKANKEILELLTQEYLK